MKTVKGKLAKENRGTGMTASCCKGHQVGIEPRPLQQGLCLKTCRALHQVSYWDALSTNNL